jgi:hypothetical protein
MKPPPRLLDDPGLASRLRADMEHAASPDVGYELAAGIAAFEQAVGLLDATAAAASGPPGAAAAAEGAGAAKVAATWSAAKVGLASLGAAVVVTSAALWPAPSAPQRTSVPPRTAAPAGVAPPAHEPTPEPAHDVDTAEARAAAVPRTPDADAELRAETAELGRIKAAIEHDPATAYRMAEQGHRKFPRGMLRQEREGLAVLALWKLGRSREAEARAQAFLLRYPRSPLREPIERELALRPSAGGGAP